jgi:hemoglobin
MKQDVKNREDVHKIISTFYSNGINDEVLGPIFSKHITEDVWSHHMEAITDFWCGILFHTSDYNGRPFPKHIPLGLKVQHFHSWLALFHHTIASHYEGVNADIMHIRADNIANMFSAKLGLGNLS